MRRLSIHIALFSILFLPLVALGAKEGKQVTLLALGSIFKGNYTDLAALFNRLFNIALFLGATLAVINIAVAGAQYMVSEASSTIKDGKERIQQSVLGLLMLLGIAIFFNQINPDILNLQFKLKEAKLNGPLPDYTPPPPSPQEPKTDKKDPMKDVVIDKKVTTTKCGSETVSCSTIVSACTKGGGTMVKQVNNSVLCGKNVTIGDMQQNILSEVVRADSALKKYKVVDQYDMSKLDKLEKQNEKDALVAKWRQQCKEKSTATTTLQFVDVSSRQQGKFVPGNGGQVHNWVCRTVPLNPNP